MLLGLGNSWRLVATFASQPSRVGAEFSNYGPSRKAAARRKLRYTSRQSVTGLPLPNRISSERDIVVELVRDARRPPTPATARIRRSALGRAGTRGRRAVAGVAVESLRRSDLGPAAALARAAQERELAAKA